MTGSKLKVSLKYIAILKEEDSTPELPVVRMFTTLFGDEAVASTLTKERALDSSNPYVEEL